MKGELLIQDYSGLLGEGLFADNIVLSLLDYKDKQSLEPKEREALERAKQFLDTVITGGNLQRGVFSSAYDVTAAKAYDSVHSQFNTRSKDFIKYISELRDTVVKILNRSLISKQELNDLDGFFSSYSRMYFQKAKSVLEAV